MVKRLLALFLVFVMMPTFSCGAEQASVEKLVQRLTPPLAVTAAKEQEKDSWYFDGYFEPADVLQGTKRGHWNELDYNFGYVHKNITGYAWISQQERFDVKNNAASLGAYINMDKDQYTHFECGLGWPTNFLYQLQSIAEYGHRVYENLFGQVGYTYRSYRGSGDDTHLVTPGLIYYFGDSYLSANYGASYMESHDTASIGVFKGDFAITKFLRWNCGVAFGGRLYDILGKDAKDEQGYILFTGVNINLYKGINCRFGYIYGTEAPKFIKRGVYYAVSAKF
ncbi:MAG: YaiO family outer membrane beta-barrel protein [Candidatus Omnitrophota bacterium]|nr:YaiO family outer membrane beta-barrel protein [Candidatus Omnitrophota bacterium]